VLTDGEADTTASMSFLLLATAASSTAICCARMRISVADARRPRTA